MPSAPTLSVGPALTGVVREQVEMLLARAEAADGYRALNEAAELGLRQDSPGSTHLTVLADDHVVGYAQLVPGQRDSTGFLVVDPPARRQGLGLRLARALVERATAPVQLLDLLVAGPTEGGFDGQHHGACTGGTGGVLPSGRSARSGRHGGQVRTCR